jgi:hypothetical protein
LDDSGTFEFSLGGKKYGIETFRIQSKENSITADAEVRLLQDLAGNPVSIQTFPKLVLDSNFHPKTYTWSLKGLQKYNLAVDFTGSRVKSQLHLPDGKDDIREFQLTKDVVVLDNNVICLYELLVQRYALTEGGKQAFQAYLPQEATPGVLTLQDAGTENVDIAGEKRDLQHLVLLTDNAQIDLWADAQHRLQRLMVSESKLEAIRQK